MAAAAIAMLRQGDEGIKIDGHENTFRITVEDIGKGHGGKVHEWTIIVSNPATYQTYRTFDPSDVLILIHAFGGYA